MLEAGSAAAKRAPMATTRSGSAAIRRPVIGLALGGGAARGFAHIGILRTLVAHGIVPDVVVGTSIGAVVGGAYAAGHLDALEEWARSLQPRSVLGYLDIRLNGSGLIGGAKLAAELEAAMGQSLIEDLPMKFATVATEVRTGHEIWLTHGPHGGCDARLLCAARNILAGAGRRPLAGRRRAGQSGAGVGGARARRGDRHRRQSFQRRLHASTTIYSHGPTAGVSVSVTPEAAPEAEPRETRHRQILLRRAHDEARVLRRRRTARHLLGDGRCLQHHAGPHHPRAARRRSAGPADFAPRRQDRLVRFSPRRRADRPRRARRRARDRIDRGGDPHSGAAGGERCRAPHGSTRSRRN